MVQWKSSIQKKYIKVQFLNLFYQQSFNQTKNCVLCGGIFTAPKAIIGATKIRICLHHSQPNLSWEPAFEEQG